MRVVSGMPWADLTQDHPGGSAELFLWLLPGYDFNEFSLLHGHLEGAFSVTKGLEGVSKTWSSGVGSRRFQV